MAEINAFLFKPSVVKSGKLIEVILVFFSQIRRNEISTPLFWYTAELVNEETIQFAMKILEMPALSGDIEIFSQLGIYPLSS